MKTTFSSVKIFFSIFNPAIKIYGLAALLFLLHLHAFAQTLEVPKEYSSIQAAIDAAMPGDTVLVSPGVYYENLQLRGRDIVLTSRFALERDISLIDRTIIDGSRPVHPDTASCLLIWKGETAATVVEGFTLRGGSGTVWLDPAGYGTFREGGGILTEYSSPVIRNNFIRNNAVAAPDTGMVSYGGGGIRCGEGAPLIEGNRIVFNRGGGYGGGIVLNYCPGAVVRNNVIAYNYGGADFSGGGFWSTGKDQSTVVRLLNNVIAFNETPAAAQKYGGKAGGVWTFSITVQMENNIIWANRQAIGQQIGQLGAAVEARFNCIEEAYPGAGNFQADPQFADTTGFILSPWSPCIDAGAPEAGFFDPSINGKQATYPSRGGLRNDAGAYGGPGRGSLTTAVGEMPPTIFTKTTRGPVATTRGDSRSVNWVDTDGDADLDLFISNGPKAGENNFLYQNTGRGEFAPVPSNPITQDGKPSDGATWADYDNDGDLDCFVVNWYNVDNLLYRNQGGGVFRQIITGDLVSSGGYSETAAWGDYDNDGWLDLYVANSAGQMHNFLYRNAGDGTFQTITAGAPVTDAFPSRCVNWVDYDGDGDSDLFVTNENGENETLYRNDGGGAFSRVPEGPLVHHGGNTMSASWGDYDNDGDPDVFLANDSGGNALFRNDGNGNFFNITEGPVVRTAGSSFGSQWADVDNDGDLDLFVTNAFGKKAWRNFLFFNNGDGSFRRDTLEAPAQDSGWSYGCAFGDMDRDGDLDLAVANCFQASQPDELYENHASESRNHWLTVQCTGTVSNRSAIGAEVRLRSMLHGKPVVQMRDVSAQSGYCGQNQLATHFGLGENGQVSALEVRWPSGITELYAGDLPVDQYVTITENLGLTGIGNTGTIAPLLAFSLGRTVFPDSIQLTLKTYLPRRIRVEVRDASGKLVVRLADRLFEPGSAVVAWDGKKRKGNSAPNGYYQIYIQSDGIACQRQVLKTASRM